MVSVRRSLNRSSADNVSRSLQKNTAGLEGANALSAALQENHSLMALKYVASGLTDLGC